MSQKRKTKEQFDKEISEKYNENLESINFITTKYPVTIRCKDCGYEKSFTEAANFIYCSNNERKGFCPNCREQKASNRWTHKDFLEEVKKRNPNSFEFLTTYRNREADITAKCLKCGQIFTRYARAFLLGRACPLCSYKKSMSENIIIKILKDLNLEYIHNYILTDFDHRKSFDFKVFINKEQNIYFLIEADGIQHFEYNDFLHSGDINNFYSQQNRDRLKNEYCKANHIPLLRIPYYEDEEKLIKQFLQTIYNLESSTTIVINK